ncbi:aspartate/glutamate racemase family protein [candidate division KSB1 bacterium]
MKILIINPNSDPDMTAVIRKSAVEYIRGRYEVDCVLTPGAPKFIDTFEDKIKNGPGMAEVLKENEGEFDAFIVACHDDPNLDAMKEITDKPVVGIGEASMKLATMLGHRFSIVITSRHSIPYHETLVRKYHLEDSLASIRAPRPELKDAVDEERYLDAARTAIEEDMAEVIVLGCAGLGDMDKRLQKQLGVPVLDGVACALMIAEGLVKYGAATSKIGMYTQEYDQ